MGVEDWSPLDWHLFNGGTRASYFVPRLAVVSVLAAAAALLYLL